MGGRVQHCGVAVGGGCVGGVGHPALTGHGGGAHVAQYDRGGYQCPAIAAHGPRLTVRRKWCDEKEQAMKLIQRRGLTLGLMSALLALVACGGKTPTTIVPAGATSGLNTFIYVYTDN